MYENIGEKIKTVAKVACWIGIVFCIISGIYFLFNHVYIAGLFWLTAGPILSWVGTFVLYGFGELIVGVTKIEYKINLLAEPTNQSESVLSRLIKNSTTLQTDKQQGWKCQCGRINPIFVGTCACGKKHTDYQTRD